VNRIASLLAGVLITIPQFGLARAFDAGLVRPHATFYLACALAAFILGLAARMLALHVAFVCVGAIVATRLLYKMGIQSGQSSELANDLDWTVVLLLTAAGVCIGAAAAVRVMRRQAAS